MLVHTYLVDNSEKLLTPKGRNEMLADIERFQKLLRKADEIVESLVDRYLSEHAVDLEEITRQLDSLWIDDGEPSQESD